MLRFIFAFLLLLLPIEAEAQQCIATPLPFVFQNGTVADATQVNTDLNTIVTGVNNCYLAGSWTPNLAGATTPGALDITSASGSYEQWGRMVTARFSMSWTGIGSSAVGNITLTGFPSSNNGPETGSCLFSSYDGFITDSGYTSITGSMAVSANVALLVEQSTAIGNQSFVTPTMVQNAGTLSGVCSYRSS